MLEDAGGYLRCAGREGGSMYSCEMRFARLIRSSTTFCAVDDEGEGGDKSPSSLGQRSSVSDGERVVSGDGDVDAEGSRRSSAVSHD